MPTFITFSISCNHRMMSKTPSSFNSMLSHVPDFAYSVLNDSSNYFMGSNILGRTKQKSA